MVATRERARRVSGALLVTGLALMIPGVAFAVASQTGTDAVPPTFATHAGGVLLIGTVSLTLLGLIGFASLLFGLRAIGCSRAPERPPTRSRRRRG